MKTTILVRGFEVSCLIGILDHEHTTPQRIRVSVDLTLKTNTPVSVLGESLCYMDIQTVIRSLTQNHVALVEHLATAIVDHYQNHPRVACVTVEILKLDVTPHAQGVGVRVSSEDL
jgi:dihydroneopterin aldolase